jgi:hypothetical protein
MVAKMVRFFVLVAAEFLAFSSPYCQVLFTERVNDKELGVTEKLFGRALWLF